MKKILIGASAVVIFAGLAYYPSYRAPKAHTVVEGQIAQLKQALETKEVGTFKVVNHTTGRSSSHFEVEWQFNMPQDYSDSSETPPLKARSVVDIHFGLLPSKQGFSSITSSTTSENIDTALASQGHKDGLTFDCTTVPNSKGHDSSCLTNKVTLENTSSEPKTQDIQTISIAASEVNVRVDQSKNLFDANWVVPSFELTGKDKVVGLVDNIQLQFNMPYDPTNVTAIIDSLTGSKVLDGETSSSFLIDSIKATPNNSDQSITLTKLKADGSSKTEQGITQGHMNFAIEKIEGLPADVESLKYAVKIENFDTQTMTSLTNMADPALNSPASPSAQPFDLETAQEHLVKLLSKGPKLNLDLTVMQASGDTLEIQSGADFKPGSVEDINASLAPVLASSIGDKTALLNFVLDNIAIQVNAAASTAMAQNIASLATSGGPSAPQKTPGQSDQAATQGIAMLEMLGVLAKNETGYTSKLSVDEKGILLNGKDIAPMLGLPPRAPK